MKQEQEEEKVYWLIGAEEAKVYDRTTWYRCVGIENFVKRVEKENQIVGIIFHRNNLGFIIAAKKV